MLKIGDFSKMSRISIRMLRHYDECGLLKPAEVDPFTGYRYYHEAQLLQAGRIQVLKNMGFSLAMIREILKKYTDGAKLEHFLTIKRREIEEQQQEISQRLRLIDSTIEWLRRDGNIMGYDVSLKVIPEREVASVRQIIPSYSEEGVLWKTLMEETWPQHLQAGSPCYNVAVFHDGEYKDSDVDVEIQKSVSGTYSDTEHVRFKTVAPAQIASATFTGGYEQISQVNAAVAAWIVDNGYEFDGMAFNIYHIGPYETKNPDEYVTEICYPVRKKDGK